MESQLNKNSIFKKSIDEAIKQKQFYMLYQPQVDINRNQIVGFELLLRWQHPTKGLLLPDKFFPIIKKMRKSDIINQYVIDVMIENLGVFQSKQPIKLAVNLFPCVPNLSDDLASIAVMLQSVAAPNNITFELELIESAFSHQSVGMEKALQNTIKKISDLGIQFAIDDFGIEHSSINRLVTYHFDTIKIDKFFVKKLSSSENQLAQSVIRVILSLAQDMELSVVAEGVETQAQVDQLKALGCSVIQGFYFHTPLTLEEARTLIDQNR